jgi:hypothetical protein
MDWRSAAESSRAATDLQSVLLTRAADQTGCMELGRVESNHDSEIQSLASCRWTTPESVRAVGIEPTSNGLKIRCLASRPGAHWNPRSKTRRLVQFSSTSTIRLSK